MWESIAAAYVAQSAIDDYEQRMLLKLTPEAREKYLADKLEKRKIKAIEDLAEATRALARAQQAQADASRYYNGQSSSGSSASRGIDMPTAIALDLLLKNL